MLPTRKSQAWTNSWAPGRPHAKFALVLLALAACAFQAGRWRGDAAPAPAAGSHVTLFEMGGVSKAALPPGRRAVCPAAGWLPGGVAANPEDVLACLVQSCMAGAGAGRAPPTLTPTITVIDVGANIGQTADLLIKAGAGRVVSFEPNPRTCAKYLDNAERFSNGTKPDLVCAAVGATFGTTQFVDTPASTSFMEKPASGSRPGTLMTVPVMPLASTLATLGVTAVDILKIDTQGREEGVLRGFGPDLLATTPHIVLEFSYGLLQAAGTDHSSLLHWLADAGFECRFMDKRVMTGVEPWPPAMAGGDAGAGTDAGCVSFEAFVAALKGGWTNLWCKNTRRA